MVAARLRSSSATDWPTSGASAPAGRAFSWKLISRPMLSNAPNASSVSFLGSRSPLGASTGSGAIRAFNSSDLGPSSLGGAGRCRHACRADATSCSSLLSPASSSGELPEKLREIFIASPSRADHSSASRTETAAAARSSRCSSS